MKFEKVLLFSFLLRIFEELGIILGYEPVLDLSKLGISVAELALLRVTPYAWEHYSEAQITKRIKQIPT